MVSDWSFDLNTSAVHYKEPTSKLIMAYNLGYNAGINRKSYNPPAHLDDLEFEQYGKGYEDGSEDARK